MKKIFYIAELNLPSKSAYAIHVMKMCDAFKINGNKVKLLTYNLLKDSNIYKKYNCEKKFEILSFFKLRKDFFFKRILFSIKIINYFIWNDKYDFIISRSIISAIFLSIFKKNIFLEVHHEFSGFTKILFDFTKNFKFFKKITFIFISNNLSNVFKITNKKLILDDAINLNNFLTKSKSKKKMSCVYTGSFAKGKSLEKIIQISKLAKKINFDLYGDFINSEFNIDDLNKYRNIKYKGNIPYNEIPKILSEYHVALMPYSNKVYVRASNIETSQYMSPMKMFDYLASKNIIIATKLEVYDHILNNSNSLLIKKNSPRLWAKKIKYIFSNLGKFENTKKKAYETAKKYTWNKRVNKIIESLEKINCK